MASNNADMEEANFSEMVEISLDHYKLNQFDEMFIMNYQKLSEAELRGSSRVRMVIEYLYQSQTMLKDAELLGACSKAYSLGFLYKVFFRV